MIPLCFAEIVPRKNGIVKGGKNRRKTIARPALPRRALTENIRRGIIFSLSVFTEGPFGPVKGIPMKPLCRSAYSYIGFALYADYRGRAYCG